MNTVVDLGPFRLDADAGVLMREGAPETLGPRAVALLALLVSRSPQHVSKQALLDAAWPGVVVEEANLSVQIAAIRRVLARAAGGDRWIETLARRGYRFVGPVVRRATAAPEAAAPWRRSNLPKQLTSFVGRERELVELKHLLPRTRLLTLAGAGGMGKTRLALQLAAEVSGAYRDGVRFVDLAHLADPALVPRSIAQVNGVRETPGRPLLDSLCTSLAGRELLLVVDNCEHVLESVARIVHALLQSVGSLVVVATSRERLSLAGEQTYPLLPLSLPDDAAALADLLRCEAVQLFVDRVRHRQPDFSVNVDNAAAVAKICRRLDGVPLALELAAARSDALSVEQIVARLDDRFRLLSHGSRNVLPRQQTLRATVDWSHDLLGSPERAVLRRLAVFQGGFTLDAAARVAGDEGAAELDLIDTVARLVARSLVVAEIGGIGARYRLLETTRAYALERLEEAGEADRIRRRHAEMFAALLACAHTHWQTLPHDRWMATYAPELDNVRAALQWAFGRDGDTALGIALACGSGPMWMEVALAGEGRQRLQDALQAAGAQTPPAQIAQLWLWLGMLEGEGLPDQALATLARALDAYRRLGDAAGECLALLEMVLAYARTGRLAQAEAAIAAVQGPLGDQSPARTRARCSELSALLAIRRDRMAEGCAALDRARALYRSAGQRRQEIRILGNLADTRWALGELDAAAEGFREVARLGREQFTTAKSLGFCLMNLAGVLTEAGRLDEALDAAKEGLPLATAAGVGWISMDHLALRAALAGRPDDAARVTGYVDATHEKNGAVRHVNERRARDRIEHMLARHLAANESSRLRAEGAALGDEAALRLALRS